MEEDFIKIIESYLCAKEDGGYCIYDIMTKMLVFELGFENITKRLLETETKGTILQSNLLRNMCIIGHTYTQINAIGTLFDTDTRTLSFVNLWKEVKDKLPKDDKYRKIQEILEHLQDNEVLKAIKDARNKVVCHNDKDADRHISISIREAIKLAFKVYHYFNSFLSDKYDFITFRSETSLNFELESFEKPFFKNEEEKESFAQDYKAVIKELDLEYMTKKEMQALRDSVKVEILESIK